MTRGRCGDWPVYRWMGLFRMIRGCWEGRLQRSRRCSECFSVDLWGLTLFRLTSAVFIARLARNPGRVRFFLHSLCYRRAARGEYIFRFSDSGLDDLVPVEVGDRRVCRCLIERESVFGAIEFFQAETGCT